MPAKRAAAKAGRAALRPPATDEPQETPEWIVRLRQRIEGEAPTKREWAEKAVNLVLELMDLSEAALSDAAGASDNWHAMFRAMRSAEVLEQIQKTDPLARRFRPFDRRAAWRGTGAARAARRARGCSRLSRSVG